MNKNLVILDRDGVINIDYGYIGSLERFEYTDFIWGLLDFCVNLKYDALIVTNQSGVARGFFDEGAVETIHSKIRSDFKAAGVNLVDIKTCFHHPDAKIWKYRTICSCRKPAPGMLQDFFKATDYSPSDSVLIGDKVSDVECGNRLGIPSFLLNETGDLDKLDWSLVKIQKSVSPLLTALRKTRASIF